MRTTMKLLSATAVAGIVFLGIVPARGQGGGEEIRQTVARISYVDGETSYSRGDDPDNWQPAAVNLPMTLGDRIYTGDQSRSELQIQAGSIRLAPRTDLTALNLTDDVKQFSLTAGTASFRVRRLRSDEVFEVDTPNVAVTFETPGSYRIDVDQDGNSRVAVRRGEVTVAAAGGQIPVSAGSEISIQGFDNPTYDVVALGRTDAWDRWVSFRDTRTTRARSYAYVNADVVGAEDLDRYGRWQDIPQYGQCWSPATVAVDWTPYRDGRWIWQDPWGWTWIGAEPWGWAPYHYGRWVIYSSRWYWVPAGPRVAVTYSPALVAFVGGGPGWSASVTIGGGGYVGWFPLAPRDPFIPWWGARRQTNVNVTNVTYVNQTYVTVVNQNTFVSGQRVSASIVRDPQVVRQVASAPVLRGPIPIMPTSASIRAVGVAAARPAPRPSAMIAARPVVTRVAPPPAPAPFQTKMRVIEQNRGGPVAPSVAAQLSVEAHNGARAAAPVRPAGAASTNGAGFTPRNAQTNVRPQAVTAPRGKALATADRPLVATPSAAASPNAPAPARVAPGAIAPPPPSRGGPAANRPETVTPPPRPEAWRERVPPGQERRNPQAQPTPPATREAPPSTREAAPETATPPPGRPTFAPPPPKSQQEQTPPPPRREVGPPPGRPVPPSQREAAPETTSPPREAPPTKRQVNPPPEKGAPPPRVEGERAGKPGEAPRAKPKNQKESDKDKDKDKKKKKEEPPPPPS